uniref:Glutathione S-transferase n=1 Tax=Polytomella parva TaxID=51329 RepID=A0A7S0ULC7_9CHLO|mmetsp:Transcript_13627/g.24069  ORF Transcript_13627/g.24069 Transcript_13627/m.24069 type:complete len:222 (+) Transcript_13627:33-698(+)|eukprot:CAMPEP_0175049670 /NCGR_PEP_ID=MMETSP0052_2-20121109/6851_1 /TAXON_ID=51329 ORGANISM="Polytomella parva, Strain SAG 63-3" /NCGR_SAMPLE_ID=MMETSP0052_2 /ASSEMBLY_ACC=CAM_ASM_000194 /LENGTH=221 /DNA_ID=CAMNT_0016313825 /DNA_START=23 /DNA_END=688 /DNA_ORIENTATION=+
MTITLHYFGPPGRAEVTRLLLTLGGVQFEEKRYGFGSPEWLEFKKKTPFGQAPVIELDNGEMIAQTAAVEAYAATMGGLLPKDPLSLARVFEGVHLSHEIIEPFYNSMSIKDEAARLEKRKDLVKNYLPAHLKLISDYVNAKIQKTNAFLFGETPSYADLAFFNAMGMLASGIFDGVPSFKEIFADYPVLLTLHKRVGTSPAIKAFYAKETDDIRKNYRYD